MALKNLDKVRELELVLNQYKLSVVPVLINDPFGANLDPAANPANFGNRWAPGWCNKA